MKPLKLELEGFESARDKVVVEYGDDPFIGFTGANGSGKSMLAVWALHWLLFDKYRARTKDEFISSDMGQAWGRLTFEHGGTVYRVERKQPRVGAAEATLSIRGEDGAFVAPRRAAVTDTNKRIQDLLGMDASVAEVTFMALQGEYGNFAKAAPSDRRSKLSTVLGLRHFAEKLTTVKENQRKTETDLAAAEARLAEIEAQLPGDEETESPFPELDDNELLDAIDEHRELVDAYNTERSRIIGLQQAAADQVQQIEDAVAAHHERERQKKTSLLEAAEVAASRVVEERRRVEQARERLARIRDTADGLPDLRTKVTKGEEWLKSAVAALETKRAALEQVVSDGRACAASIAEVDTRVGETEDRVAQLMRTDHAACFTCNQHLSPELLRSLLDQQNEALGQLKGQRESLVKRQSDLLALHASSKKQLSDEAAALEVHRERFRQVERSVALAEEAASVLEAEATSVADLESSLRSLEVSANEAETAARSFQESPVPESLQKAWEASRTQDTSALQRELDELNAPDETRVSLLERELGRRSAMRRQEAKLDAARTGTLAEVLSLRTRAAQLELLREAFSPKGAPAMILAGGVQEIEEIANRYLDRLSRGDLQVSISTQRETRSGSVSEDVYLEVDTPDGTRDYRTLSGGQQFRVDLAVRIALTQVCASRSGAAQVESFVVDEGWGTLDGDGILSTLEALTELSEEFKIITVSHIDAVKAGCPAIIEVSMETGTTTVKKVAA